MTIDTRETARTQARYERIAPFYDTLETLAEAQYADWRWRLWSLVKGPKVLELGVGTGKNMPYYPEGLDYTALDLAPTMLRRAQRRARERSVDVDLQLGDAQRLPYADESFDDVVSTFLFCSVPDPIIGLDEVARVLKPNGRALFLEHMRSPHPVLGPLMDLFDPVTVRLMGPHINRRTVENVERSRLRLTLAREMSLGGIFKLIVARKS